MQWSLWQLRRLPVDDPSQRMQPLPVPAPIRRHGVMEFGIRLLPGQMGHPSVDSLVIFTIHGMDQLVQQIHNHSLVLPNQRLELFGILFQAILKPGMGRVGLR